MPGAGKQPPEVQQHIKELLEAGFDPTTIHRRLKVGRSSIYRMKRCLQQHGTAYMPLEMNKKNGRPKVLAAEQELEVREWLRKPENRTRYLDDLVWFIHDRFGIVCSTTTMSKMKRKWLRVLEYEETGRPVDGATWASLLETHPDLPLLGEPGARDLAEDFHLFEQPQQQHAPPAMMHNLSTDAPNVAMHAPSRHPQDLQIPIEPSLEGHIDQHLRQQIQTEIASTDPPRV